MTNIRHFSKAHAITAASPSIGAYLLSASIQNLLPANIRCHPSGQQTGALSVVQEQCFCNRRKPIPSLLQSGSEAGDAILFKRGNAIPDEVNYDPFGMLECSFEALVPSKV